MSVWDTPGNVELLTRLWTEGKSASRIARIMGGGLTRNAVIGKVHRLRLKDCLRQKPVLAERAPSWPRDEQGAAVIALWTEEQDAKLRELATLGITKSQAASQLGRSVVAIRRRVLRLKIHWVNPTKALRQPISWGTGQVDRGERLRDKQAHYKAENKAAKTMFTAPAPADAIPLVGRPFGRCAFPVGTPDAPADQLCCGHQTVSDAHAYCERHHRIAFRVGTAFTNRDISKLASFARPKFARAA